MLIALMLVGVLAVRLNVFLKLQARAQPFQSRCKRNKGGATASKGGVIKKRKQERHISADCRKAVGKETLQEKDR